MAGSADREDSEFTTDLSNVEPGQVSVRGYDLASMIATASAAESTFLLLSGRRPTLAEVAVFDAMLVACAEHGLVNTASVVSRYVMSGAGEIAASVAAGLLAFGAHTGISHLTARMLVGFADGKPAEVSAPDLDECIRRYRTEHRTLPGLGHPLHRDNDPRTAALRRVLDDRLESGPYVHLMDRVQKRTGDILERSLVLNVDGLIGAALLDMGFSEDAIYAVNLLGTMPGIAAHAIEERLQNRPLRHIALGRTTYTETRSRQWSTP